MNLGKDRSWQIQFYRNRLEEALEDWENRGYESKDDWSREQRWMIERAAATFPPEVHRENIFEYQRIIETEKDPELRESAEDNLDFQVWLKKQSPDSWRRWEKYWPEDAVNYTERDSVDPFSAMPEFD